MRRFAAFYMIESVGGLLDEGMGMRCWGCGLVLGILDADDGLQRLWSHLQVMSIEKSI